MTTHLSDDRTEMVAITDWPTAYDDNVTATVQSSTTTTSSNDVSACCVVLMNVLHSLVLVCSLYIFVTLSLYEHRRKAGVSSVANGTITHSISPVISRRSTTTADWLRRLCILGAVLCVCVCVIDLVYYNVKFNSNLGCTVAKNADVLLLIVLDTTVYFFLWLRQHVLYRKLHIESRYLNIFISVCNWGVLGLIVSLSVGMIVILCCCRRYEYNVVFDACTQIDSKADETLSGLWGTGSVVIHVMLVALFVFPLLKYYYDCRRSNGRNTTTAFASTRSHILILVRRCFLVSLACTLSDIFVNLTTEYLLQGPQFSQVRHLLYNANVLLNVTLIVCSFKEWKEMLFPWVARCEKRTEEEQT